jgi:YfiH family protein
VFESKSPFLIVPRLVAVPGLVHGFGDARWSESDFMGFAASKGMTPVVMRQVHSDVVRRLDAAPAGKPEGDALMTNVPGLVLVVRTADCLPVLLVDEENRAVAAVHCGWRGTEKRILEKAVRAMGEAYGSKAGTMLAVLGPCIGAACYEVGPEVREGFLKAGFPENVFAIRGHVPEVPVPAKLPAHEARGHVPEVHVPVLKRKFLLDLGAANLGLLRGLGFKKANIFNPGPACTHCEPRLLSYRRNSADPRRMFNFVGLKAG